MAAVLACGPEAVLGYRSGVALWGLRPRSPGPIDVVVPGRSRRGQKGIRVHNVRSLADVDRSVVDSIPVTSVARTLLDYATVARPQELRLALEAADRLELFDGRAFDELLARSPGHHGVGPLKRALAELTGPPPWTQSELERRFLALIREAGILAPSANVVVAGITVDFHWPRQHLVVEVDGYRYHRSRRAFENDRRRDARLQLAGYRVLRFTHRQITDSPGEVVGMIRSLLRKAPSA